MTDFFELLVFVIFLHAEQLPQLHINMHHELGSVHKEMSY